MEAITIVIPAYNEEGVIGAVVQAVLQLRLSTEVLVVDDGSTDGTAAEAEQSGARVIRHPINRGYGASLKTAIQQATHDTVFLIDADGTYPIEKIPELLQEFSKGFDMVVGARQGSAYRGSFLKMPARFVFKFLVEMTTGRRIPDINSGMRVFRKSTALHYFADICDGFSFTTTITLIYMLTGKSVGYLPIPYHKRIGRSKVKMLRDTFRTLQYITECIVRYNPLKLFLLLTGLTLIWGLLSSIVLGPIAFYLASLTAGLMFVMGLVAEAMRRPRV